MSKTTDALLVAGGAIGLYYLLTRANTIRNLNFIPKGIGFSGGAAVITLGVQNPTSTSLAFGSLVGNLYVGGKLLGNVTDFQPVEIAGNAETDVKIRIVPNVFGIAAGVLDAATGNEPSISASFQGTANIDNTAMPVNVDF